MERFTIPKLEARIDEIGRHAYRRSQAARSLRSTAGWPPEAERPEYDDAAWDEPEAPFVWGGRDVKAYLRCRFTVPDDWPLEQTALRVVLSEQLDVSGPDATAYIDGVAIQGVDIYHSELLLPADLARGEHVLALEAYSGTRDERHWFGGVQLVLIDEEARGLYFDALVALQSAKELAETRSERAAIINVLEQALLARRTFASHWVKASGSRCLPRAACSPSSCTNASGPASARRSSGVGHAHIDVAWLWTLRAHAQEDRPHLLDRPAADGAVPRVPLHAVAAAALRLLRAGLPGALRPGGARVREGRWEADRRHVARGRQQRHRRRVARAPGPLRQALPARGVRRGRRGALAARRLRLQSWALPQIMARPA